MATVWRYTVIGESPSGEERWACNLHYQTDVPIAGSEPGAQEVLDELDQHFSSSGTDLAKWRNTICSTDRLVETRIYEEVLDPKNTPHEGHVNVYNLAGNGNTPGTDVLPTALCAYITLFTGKIGKSFRGGVHTPPSRRASDLDGGGTWDTSTSAWTHWGNLGTSIVDQLENVFQTTGDINPVIYSRKLRQLGSSDYANKLTTYRLNTDPRFLRRRVPSTG